MRHEKPKVTEAQYLEANRLYREGYLPVSNKYQRAKAPPAFPPEEQLLALLKRLDPHEYEELKRNIEYAIARVIGDREVFLDQGTYIALKTLQREAFQGRLSGYPKPPTRQMNERTIEVRYPNAPTVSRELLDLPPSHERGVLTAIAMEELAKFPEHPLSARDSLETALAFLQTNGVEVVLLSPEEERSRYRRIFLGDTGDDPEGDIEEDDS